MADAATLSAPPALAPNKPLTVRIAERYGVEPGRMLDTLKATAFKTDKPISNEQMMALLIVADQYHLNPFTRELFAFPDQRGGIVPVVSVDGWSRIINEHPKFDGVQFDYREGEGEELACVCIMHRKDRRHPIVIMEYLRECKRNTPPWGSHPRRMLRHKALIQCARLAFGFAGIYDEDEARRIINLGDAQEVEAPSTSATRVRAALLASDRQPRESTPPTADPSAGAAASGGAAVSDAPHEERKTFAEWVFEIQHARDVDDATIILEESRHVLTPSQHKELAGAYQAKWQPE